MLLLAISVAAVLRFWQLGDIPPGFYRDEAYNGLDALGVLSGKHSLFFAANNGREPAYIYLSALAIALFGQTALAVRLTAALVGTLTTPLFYLLGNAWFGRRAGLLAAWLWAVAFWPIHLSRIGLRPILFVASLTLALWLGTLAYRRQHWQWWALAGIAYALTFYTYLASRFTPLLLLLLFVMLIAQPAYRSRLWPGIAWFAALAALGVLPILIASVQDLQILLGRTQQVSILNPAVNGGDLLGTLWRQVGLGLGLTVWRGDTIWRHNLPGRPVLDFLMALPFFIGLAVSLRRWQRPANATLVLWLLIMLGPTILAEDAPHFLRAVGALPPLLLLTALGLSKLRDWPTLPSVLQKHWPPAKERRWRNGLVILLCAATLALTVRDYFFIYTRQAETAFFFEAAARNMTEQINKESEETTVYIDERYWNGSWPAVNYLVDAVRPVISFAPEVGLPCTQAAACDLPFAVYTWPFSSLRFIPEAIEGSAEIVVQPGSLARGDLEPDAYPFFVRFHAGSLTEPAQPLANFGDQMQLMAAEFTEIAPDSVQIELLWSTQEMPDRAAKIFVHVVDGEGQIVAQSDAILAGGFFPIDRWRPGLFVREEHNLDLSAPFDSTNYDVLVGVFDPATEERLPIVDAAGNPVGDAWLLPKAESR